MSAPKVFLSYSHDSPEHKEWVLKLATDLRNNGVDATLDQWELVPGQDVTAFMQNGIVSADRVLMVCSDTYVSKAEAGVGGVGFERLIVTAEVVQSIDTKKFIPLVRGNSGATKVPRFLGPRLYIDFTDDTAYLAKREELLRELLGAPAAVKPPLGASPFSGEAPKGEEPMRVTGPTGITKSGAPVLSEGWFESERATAEKGLIALGLVGHMELRFGLHDGINKSQIELLNAVRKSEIHAFGWPIGVTLENRDEYRPRPYGDGIRAEVSIKEESLSGRQSYDYWAARKTGDFFLLQSLFEDMRVENQIFFNTRIVRITEALLFASNLYTNLGVPPDARLSIRVTHRGLAGRSLTSSSPNRHIFPKTTREAQSETDIVVVLGAMKDTLVDDVRRVAEPLFMLFDFQELQPQIYNDIVRRFEQGNVS